MKTIIVKELDKNFKNKSVLCKVSIECEGGKIYGISGYNGSGKTVFFKCLCGFILPTAGEIVINGIKQGEKEFSSNRMGVIIEEPAFIKGKSAFKNLDYLYRINNKRNKNHIYSVLEDVGLDGHDRKKVGKYSLGMKQRLAIAQAIMEDPDILILDEPMNGLDKKGIEEIRKLLLLLKNKGKTILLASHNAEDIKILCDKVYHMEEGTLNEVNSGEMISLEKYSPTVKN